LWFDKDPCDHSWWPREGDSDHAYAWRALETRRSAVESLYSVLKHCGVGVHDGRALWARDAGINWLLGLHLLGRSAKRLAHETGAYAVFEQEYRALGLHQPGATPDDDLMVALTKRRPPHLQWSWPAPARAGWSQRRAA
jgi:hypothetical protein